MDPQLDVLSLVTSQIERAAACIDLDPAVYEILVHPKSQIKVTFPVKLHDYEGGQVEAERVCLSWGEIWTMAACFSLFLVRGARGHDMHVVRFEVYS